MNWGRLPLVEMTLVNSFCYYQYYYVETRLKKQDESFLKWALDMKIFVLSAHIGFCLIHVWSRFKMVLLSFPVKNSLSGRLSHFYNSKPY